MPPGTSRLPVMIHSAAMAAAQACPGSACQRRGPTRRSSAWEVANRRGGDDLLLRHPGHFLPPGQAISSRALGQLVEAVRPAVDEKSWSYRSSSMMT